jgi:HAD superfamily hydrolase (TIGR01549 family)
VIRAVVFDVGEVLVDESREYGTWADWLGVPRHTFSAVFGATVASGRDYRETFQVFLPGFDLTAERRARAQAGQPETFGEHDLYTDVRGCLAALQGMALRVGAAGNQAERTGSLLQDLALPVDWIGTSSQWGVEKPAVGFFHRAVEESGVEPGQVLYVGDRLDNDVRPALAAGLQAVLIRRGPWGLLLSDPPTERRCLAVLPDLTGLPTVVAEHNRVRQGSQAARR